MKHPEADYINAGARYQLAKTPAQTIAQAGTLRRMLESERIDDRAEARRLIETGRAEVRQR
jgi:hypothetical protein